MRLNGALVQVSARSIVAWTRCPFTTYGTCWLPSFIAEECQLESCDGGAQTLGTSITLNMYPHILASGTREAVRLLHVVALGSRTAMSTPVSRRLILSGTCKWLSAGPYDVEAAIWYPLRQCCCAGRPMRWQCGLALDGRRASGWVCRGAYYQSCCQNDNRCGARQRCYAVTGVAALPNAVT